MAWEGIVAALDDARVNEQQVVESEHLMKALLEEKNGLAGRIFAKAGLPKASVLQATVDFKSQPPKVKGETSELIIGKHLGLVLNNAGKHRKEMGDDFISVEHLVLAFNSDERFGQQLFKSLQLSKKDVKYAIQAVRGNQRETDQSPKGKNRVLDMYGIDLTELARRGKFDPVIGREDEIKRCTEILSSKKKNNPVLIGEPGVGKTAIVEGLAQKIVHRKVPESLLNTKLISLDMGSLVAGTEHRGDFGKRLKAVLEKVTTSNGQIILFIDEVHTIVGAGDSSGAMNAGNLLKPMLGQGELRCIGATTLKEYTKYIEKDPALERRFQPVFCSQPSVEDTISILHGLQESYELHHGVKISNSALVSAAVLANRYITHRFFPDKAISLIDEAAAHLKTEITFMPTELEEIDRVVAKLEIEKFSLRNDRDEASKERSRKLEHDLRLLNEKQKELTEEWNHEKSLMTRMQSINEAAERELNMNCSAKHKCRTLISLYYQLEETKKNLHDFQKSANSFLRDEVTDDDIAQVVSNWTGIPLSNLQQSEKDKLFLLEQVLHKRVIGQNIAVTSIAKAIRRSRAGLSNPNRPTASFLFMGPTGVGKTELAKALASYLFNTENALVRIDMSEYMEKHSVSRLVGAPPGYAGYEEGGQLTEVVRRRPYSIVLFDEIEKAHRDISNILLQVLDDGRITDSQGRTVNFTNCIVIMTSNIGSDHILEKFSNMKDSKDVVYELMREEVVELAMKTFRREFMSRIGNHIIFLPLDSTEICMVAEIQIKQLRDRLQQKNINLLCTKEAIELIGTLGFDPRNGARLLRRIIEELVEDELAEQILSGSVKGNDTIIIDVDVSSTTEDLPPKKRLHIKKLESESISDDIVAED